MSSKNEQAPISFQEARKLFTVADPEADVAAVRSSIWEQHWANARNATSQLHLQNMLKNHQRLFNGEPSASGFACDPDRSPERSEIISFIQARLEKEFGQQNSQLQITDKFTLEDASIYSVCLAPGAFVDVKVCEDSNLIYVMQNHDGSTVYGAGGNSLTLPNYCYDETAVIQFVRDSYLRDNEQKKPSLNAQIENASRASKEDILVYDRQAAARLQGMKDLVDVLSPQETANHLGKPIRDGDDLYFPQRKESNLSR